MTEKANDTVDLQDVWATSTFETKMDEIETTHANTNCTLTDLEQIVKDILSTIPNFDRDKLRKEMMNMDVSVYQTPTTFDINKGLALCQGYKDRLVEIWTIAQHEYRTRKRCVEMLFDAYNVISKGASADKRKGEATMRYPIDLINLEAAEIFVKEVEQFLANMKSVSDSVSRQGSMIQSQISLGEYTHRKNIKQPTAGGQAEEIDYHSGLAKSDLSWDAIG